MAEEKVVRLGVGCHPEAAISGAVLLQSECATFLLFNAMSDDKNSEGRYEDVGTAVMEFDGCSRTLFGGPNDEALPEHPLWKKGLSEIGYGIGEVLHSSWASDVMERARKSAERIWGDGFEKAYKNHVWATRHIIVTFHDSTFECLTKDFRLSIRKEAFGDILDELTSRIMRE